MQFVEAKRTMVICEGCAKHLAVQVSLMEIKLDFPHTYDIEIPPELPGTGENVFYIPGDRDGGRHNGALILVHPREGRSWFGVVSGMRSDYSAVGGIYSCPDENQFCIVVDGVAYYIDSRDPSVWTEIPIYCVEHVHTLLSKELLFFVTSTEIVAQGREGVRWQTERLALDGISVTSIGEDLIKGASACFCSADAAAHEFQVDVKTGKHTGGYLEFH